MCIKKKYDVFISYRRDGGYEVAKHLYDLLTKDGYSVSFDIDTLRSGEFPTMLLDRIDQSTDFIIILNRNALDRCLDDSVDKNNDWLRNELAYAIQTHKNIIPILASGFVFPENLPEDIANLPSYNSIFYNEQYFDAMYDRLKGFLKSHPVQRIRRILLLSLLTAVLAGILFFSVNHRRTEVIPPVPVDLSSQVLINARLLDTVFIKTDSVVSKSIDYDSYMGIDRELGLGPFYNQFHYIDTVINGIHAIRPDGRYVGDYYLHDSIAIQDCPLAMLGEDIFTNQHYPVLDVSLVNNSSNTILVNDLLIEVEDSHVDDNPFVIIEESSGHLYLSDCGWKSWQKASLRFSLLPEDQLFDGVYKFEIPILSSSVDPEWGIIDIPMYDFLVRSGIDFDKLCSCSIVHKEYEGEIPSWDNTNGILSFDEDGEPYYEVNYAAIDSLKGILSPIKLYESSYISIDEDGHEELSLWYEDPYLVLFGELVFDNGASFKVGGHVRILTSEAWGAPCLSCSQVFDVKLRNEGTNYSIKYPVSHYLKAGDVDRIVIKLDADKTSYHKLRVRLHNVNQIDIQTEPIDLLIFKYRFDSD